METKLLFYFYIGRLRNIGIYLIHIVVFQGYATKSPIITGVDQVIHSFWHTVYTHFAANISILRYFTREFGFIVFFPRLIIWIIQPDKPDNYALSGRRGSGHQSVGCTHGY
jgi:hypothetical protein